MVVDEVPTVADDPGQGVGVPASGPDRPGHRLRPVGKHREVVTLVPIQRVEPGEVVKRAHARFGSDPDEVVGAPELRFDAVRTARSVGAQEMIGEIRLVAVDEPEPVLRSIVAARQSRRAQGVRL